MRLAQANEEEKNPYIIPAASLAIVVSVMVLMAAHFIKDAKDIVLFGRNVRKSVTTFVKTFPKAVSNEVTAPAIKKPTQQTQKKPRVKTYRPNKTLETFVEEHKLGSE